MPIYEYQCEKCGVVELTQKITEKALTRCPTCKAKVKRLISNTSFQLKGSGWYITDYARKDKGGAKDGKAEKAPAAEANADGKAAQAEAKADGKADGKPKDAGEGSSAEKKPAKAAASASSAD